MGAWGGVLGGEEMSFRELRERFWEEYGCCMGGSGEILRRKGMLLGRERRMLGEVKVRKGREEKWDGKEGVLMDLKERLGKKGGDDKEGL